MSQYILKNISKYCTSNDANAKVEVKEGAPKRSGYHRDPTHKSTQYDYWPASKAIDQHSAHWSCKEKEEDKKKDRERRAVQNY